MTECGKAVLTKGDDVCDFCGRTADNVIKYGAKYRLGNITAHYYCVLLSSKLMQNGEDDEGIFGFLLEDIKKELKICADYKCIYCGKNSATVFCSDKKCGRKFHLPCGLKKGSLHKFKKNYNSYCHTHAKLPCISKKFLGEIKAKEIVCGICYDYVSVHNKMKFIWATCCQENIYHKKCIQEHALSAGYLFRCPRCNNDKEFIKWVLKFGIYIPQQDASWELEPNAFSELLLTYNRCDAVHCKCHNGRDFSQSENPYWEIILCKFCGSQGIHKACKSSNSKSLNWGCPNCQKIMEKFKKNKKLEEKLQNELETSVQEEVFTKKRIRSTENFISDKRKKCKTDIDEDDTEIDVVTVDRSTSEIKTVGIFNRSPEMIQSKRPNLRLDVKEALASIRPGPLSFKLRTMKNYCKNQ